MKKALIGLLSITLVSAFISSNVTAKPSEKIAPLITFNHAGVQKGARFNLCYREPCAAVQITSFKQIGKRPAHSDIELGMKTGDYNSTTKKVKWTGSDKIIINCAYEMPTITAHGESNVLPLNSYSDVPGVWANQVQLYSKACHNEMNYNRTIAKYHYNVVP